MMTISKVTRVTAKSGDYSNVTNLDDGRIMVQTMIVANATELEAFGNALVDVACEMKLEAAGAAVAAVLTPVPVLDPSVEDAIATYADAHAAEAAS